jgi:hypothetical protein
MMAESLFDTVFSGYSVPLQAEYLKQETDLKKVQVQQATQQLAQEKDLMSAAGKIFGPGGLAAAADSTQNPDERDMAKYQQFASYLMSKGYVGDATKVLGAMGSVSEKAARTSLLRNQAAMKMQTDISNWAGGMAGSDQTTYSAAFPDFLSTHPGVQKMGLTGILDQDMPKLQLLARTGETFKQQQDVADRQKRQADLNSWRGTLGNLAQQRIVIQQARLAQGSQRLAQVQDYHQWQKDEAAKRDVRAQESLDIRKEISDQKGNKSVLSKRLAPEEMGLAQAAIGDNYPDLPKDQQTTAASMAAMFAKKYYPNLSYPEGLVRAMDDMEKEGLFYQKPAEGGFFGTPAHKAVKLPPAGKGPGGASPPPPLSPSPKGSTANPPLPPQVRTAADYEKLPKGAQYLTPDGKLKVKQ